MKNICLLGFCLLVILAHSPSYAAQFTVITKCTHGQGYAYFPSGGVVPKDQSGRQKDGFSVAGGRGQLILSTDGKDVDLITSDPRGTRSLTEDGGKIVSLGGGSANSLLVTVIYPTGPTVETYVFLLDETGTGQLLWTAAKATALLSKAGSYVGACRK